MDHSLTSFWNNVTHTFTTGLNDWGSIHPFVVHIPIALLFVVPLFILLGMILQNSSKSFYVSALILMLLGTSSIYLAVSTGEQASESVKPTPEILKTLETHDHLAEQAKLYFSILSAIFLVYVFLFSYAQTKYNIKTYRIVLILFFFAYTYCLILLFNVAHYGGKLVHQHGIKSSLYSDPK